MASIRLPDDTQRTSIVGATGSGKTQAAVWQLSRRDFDQKPWIVIDFKLDKLINEIPGAQHLTFESELPERPGIYIYHPTVGDEDRVEDLLWKIWRQEHTGLYIDEGYMIGNSSKSFRAILTQGRSKHIPVITLTQRPVWIDRFVFSEAEFFQVFRLQHTKDIRKIEEYIPFDLSKRLPRYHSYYYDVDTDSIVVLTPVPDRDAILDTFRVKLSQIPKVV